MKKKVIISLMLLLVISSLFIINIYSLIKKDKKVELTTTTTTTKSKEDLLSDEFVDKLIVNGEESEIIVRKYRSLLGYSFNYEASLFSPVVLSNSTIELRNITDQNVFIRFEKMIDENYYDEYERLNNQDEIVDDMYIDTYSFIRYKSIFLKITKRKQINNEDLNIRIGYVVNSLEFN